MRGLLHVLLSAMMLAVVGIGFGYAWDASAAMVADDGGAPAGELPEAPDGPEDEDPDQDPARVVVAATPAVLRHRVLASPAVRTPSTRDAATSLLRPPRG